MKKAAQSKTKLFISQMIENGLLTGATEITKPKITKKIDPFFTKTFDGNFLLPKTTLLFNFYNPFSIQAESLLFKFHNESGLNFFHISFFSPYNEIVFNNIKQAILFLGKVIFFAKTENEKYKVFFPLPKQIETAVKDINLYEIITLFEKLGLSEEMMTDDFELETLFAIFNPVKQVNLMIHKKLCDCMHYFTGGCPKLQELENSFYSELTSEFNIKDIWTFFKKHTTSYARLNFENILRGILAEKVFNRKFILIDNKNGNVVGHCLRAGDNGEVIHSDISEYRKDNLAMMNFYFMPSETVITHSQYSLFLEYRFRIMKTILETVRGNKVL